MLNIYIFIIESVMNQIVTSILLASVIIAEIVLLTLNDREYFGAYIDIVVVILFALAAYFVFRMLQIGKKIPPRLI